MTTFSFIVPYRPLSHQASSASKENWKQIVHGRAFQDWRGTPITKSGIKFTLVYLCESDPPDINNIIKPVQDSLNGLVYTDDCLVTDVDGHMRLLGDPIDTAELPDLLQKAVFQGGECIYVRVSMAGPLGTEL